MSFWNSFLSFFSIVSSTESKPEREPEPSLRYKLGQMVMVGFNESEVTANSPIVQDIQSGCVGGIILYKKNVREGHFQRNLVSPQQVLKLTSDLQSYAPIPLLVACDIEGGKVKRLNADNGFFSKKRMVLNQERLLNWKLCPGKSAFVV